MTEWHLLKLLNTVERIRGGVKSFHRRCRIRQTVAVIVYLIEEPYGYMQKMLLPSGLLADAQAFTQSCKNF